jgi:hypothetical protein
MPRKGDCKSVFERIRGKYVVNEFTHCWLWQCGRSSQGKYPTIGISRTKIAYVHRLLWEGRNGQLPHGLSSDGTRWELHHGCGNKLCVNPSHVVLMSRRKHVDEESRWRALVRAAETR